MNTKDARSARKELAATILKRLNYLPEYIRAFKEEDRVGTSEAHGFVYWANESQRKTIAELEEEGKTVFAVIHGVYRVGTPQFSDEIEMTAYLFVSDMTVNRAAANLAAGRDALHTILEDRKDKYGYNILAYVEGYDGEFGDICVRGWNGGLRRTA